MENLETKELEQNRDSTGRPPKALNPFFLEAMEKVLEDPDDGGINNILACTDEELLLLINAELPEHHRASQSARDYAMSKSKSDESIENLEIKKYTDTFKVMYKKALISQKKNLLEKLQEDENKRQKRAWILERKFTEWNLKHISEHKATLTVDHKYNINIIQPSLPKGADILEGVEVVNAIEEGKDTSGWKQVETRPNIEALTSVGY